MKLSDRLFQINEDITIRKASNGYVIEASGRDTEGKWIHVRLVCNNLDEVDDVIKEFSSMPNAC